MLQYNYLIIILLNLYNFEYFVYSPNIILYINNLLLKLNLKEKI